MKERILLLLKALGNYAKKLGCTIWELLNNKSKMLEQQIMAQQKINENILANDMMHRLAHDLYEVFHGGNYRLEQISFPKAIRVNGYDKVNGIYQYYFLLNKKTETHLPRDIWDEVRDSMNKDIEATQRVLLETYGPEYCYYTYPFLYHGIEIESVREYESGNQVVVTVCSRLTPYDFLRMYRQ